MTIVASGRFGTVLQVTARVRKNVEFTPGTPFWKACKRALKKPEFNQLMDKGFCFHKFGGERDLMLTFRAQLVGRLLQANIDVIDPHTKQVVGIFDFEVLGEDEVRACELVIMPQAAFSNPAQEALLQAGFDAEQILPYNFVPLRWPPGQVAFWIREGYRQQDDTGFDGLSHVLMSTAVRIAKGLGISRFVLDDVGDPFEGDSRLTMIDYYTREFGAEVASEEHGQLLIRI